MASRLSDFTVLTSVLSFIGVTHPGDIQSATLFCFHKLSRCGSFLRHPVSISVSTSAFLPLLSTLSHLDWLPMEESGVEIRSSCFPVCCVLLEDSVCFGTSSSLLRALPG